MKPRNRDSRRSGRALLNRVIRMQYTEKPAINARSIVLGTPSHTRVLDSRSYFFITASTSAWMSCSMPFSSCTRSFSISTTGSLCFLNRPIASPP